VTESERPYTLVAELTYRCPLRCVLTVCQALPLLLLGITPDAFFAYAIFAGSYGQLQHGNVALDSGNSHRVYFRSGGSGSRASASSGSTMSRSPFKTPRRRPRIESRASARSSASWSSRAG